MALMPRRVKFRKSQRGSRKGNAGRGTKVDFGEYGLQTLRVPIDYGFAEAKTVYGIIGVKCWVNQKEETTTERRGMALAPTGNRS